MTCTSIVDTIALIRIMRDGGLTMKKLHDTQPQEKLTYLTDLPLACFLCIRGVQLVDIRNKENSKRVVFVFPDNEEVHKLKMEFFSGGLAPVRDFYSAYKMLKRRVYEVLERD